MEMEKVPKAGYPIISLPIAGINRSSMLANWVSSKAHIGKHYDKKL